MKHLLYLICTLSLILSGYAQQSVELRYPLDRSMEIIPAKSHFYMDTITLLSGDQLIWQLRIDRLKKSVNDTIKHRLILTLRNLTQPDYFLKQTRESDYQLSPDWYTSFLEEFKNMGDETKTANDGRKYYKFALWVNATLKMYCVIFTDPTHHTKTENWLLIAPPQ